MKNRITDYLPAKWRSKLMTSDPQGNVQLPDMEKLTTTLTETVTKHPGPSLAAAFVLGVTIAWWIKRK